MGTPLKLVSTLKKADTVNENTVQNSQIDKKLRYNQFRLDELEKPVEGIMLPASPFRRWEYSIKTESGKVYNIKRSKLLDRALRSIDQELSKTDSGQLVQDIYRFEYLGSDIYKSGRAKKHHFRIQVHRFQYSNGIFRPILGFRVSTKKIERNDQAQQKTEPVSFFKSIFRKIRIST